MSGLGIPGGKPPRNAGTEPSRDTPEGFGETAKPARTCGVQARLGKHSSWCVCCWHCTTQSRVPNLHAQKISSVTDRARLLGSVLTEYDANICRLYQGSIGGSKQPYFQIRRDLQQQFVLKLHRKYSLSDILTLDVLKLSQTKTIGTTALTNTDIRTEELT